MGVAVFAGQRGILMTYILTMLFRRYNVALRRANPSVGEEEGRVSCNNHYKTQTAQIR